MNHFHLIYNYWKINSKIFFRIIETKATIRSSPAEETEPSSPRTGGKTARGIAEPVVWKLSQNPEFGRRPGRVAFYDLKF